MSSHPSNPKPILLTVNGEPHRHQGSGTLTALLAEMDIGSKPVAVLINDAVVNDKDRRRARVKDGDLVEVLIFAGGG